MRMTDAALHTAVHSLLQQNTRTHQQYTYTVPSPSSYPYQWLWDSCWHAIIWSYFDTDRAAAELRALVAKQHPNGLIGHITYWDRGDILDIDWGLSDTSSLLQPPLLAYALWRIYEQSQDTALLAELYPALQQFYGYILRTRDVRSIGLYGIVNPDESGEDNAPRFDDALGLPAPYNAHDHLERRYRLFHRHRQCAFKPHCTAEYFWTEDLAFNTYLQWNLTVLADIATHLEKKKDANRWQRSATDLKRSMRTKLFQNGTFHSLTGLVGVPTTDASWTQFLPLSTGLYSQSEAHRLVTTTLTDPDQFWLPHGLPTVAKSDPTYCPTEPEWGAAWQHPDWRGAAWIVPHWCVYHGLQRYGFASEAATLREKSLQCIERHGFRENYHPETGVGMGAEDFTWGGLVLDMQ